MVFISILDSGINPNRSIFINPDGSSRIFCIWDQTAVSSKNHDELNFQNLTGSNSNQTSNFQNQWNTFPSVPFGRLILNSEINTSLIAEETLITDISGHGTAVAGIAVDKYISSSYKNQTPLVIVKLREASGNSSKDSSIMYGADFCARLSAYLKASMIINLSYGNNNGCLNNDSVLQKFFRSLGEIYKLTFIVAAGNEALSGGHATINPSDFNISTPNLTAVREFVVGENESSLSFSICYSFRDDFDFYITAPNGETAYISPPDTTYVNGISIAAATYGPSAEYSNKFIRILFITNMVVPSGLWKITLTFNSASPINTSPNNIFSGNQSITDKFSANSIQLPYAPVSIKLPVSEARSKNTYFLTPDPLSTITSPAVSPEVITVGALNQTTLRPASFSGIGNVKAGFIKPDILAPGVNVKSPAESQFSTRSGTSFATPFISGLCARIIEENESSDPFLYGNKLKALLISLATPVKNSSVPDSAAGWGYFV